MGHSLSLLETSPYPTGGFRCNLCGEEGCGPVYHCSDCDFDVHVACAATATQQTHFTHPHHPLHLSHCGNRARRCDSCGSGIHTWSFRCDICNFDIHSMCGRAPRFIKHKHHSHPLALSKSDDFPGLRQCNGCKMPATNYFYRCHSCQYDLHQVCATLPSRIKHVKHQAHMLTVVDHPPQEGLSPTCNECRRVILGWHFHCALCKYYLHPGCANLVHELPHFNVEVNTAHQSSNATTSVNPSIAHRVFQAPMPLTSHNASSTRMPNAEVNTAHQRSNATTSVNPSIAHRVFQAPMPLTSHNVSSTCMPNVEINTSHQRSNGTTSVDPSIALRVLHAPMPLTSHNASSTCVPNDKDWESVEKVLRFAREMAKGAVSHAAEGVSPNQAEDEQDHCPTCLEGFDSTNPKKSTSCGHHFHLACILEWMERSTDCPICRKRLNISM